MSHQETYRHNEAYAEFLENWDANFYAKYADTLSPATPGARVLDVGCGVGQVVARLTEAGYEAHGVDVSEPNIGRARKFSDRCQLYNGKRLPFPDNHFDVAVSIGLLVLSIWIVLWISAKLYRVGILMYGKRATLPELVRWLRYS